MPDFSQQVSPAAAGAEAPVCVIDILGCAAIKAAALRFVQTNSCGTGIQLRSSVIAMSL
jgi:hypothetical protein